VTDNAVISAVYDPPNKIEAGKLANCRTWLRFYLTPKQAKRTGR
jgi:hypothetical protein